MCGKCVCIICPKQTYYLIVLSVRVLAICFLEDNFGIIWPTVFKLNVMIAHIEWKTVLDFFGLEGPSHSDMNIENNVHSVT